MLSQQATKNGGEETYETFPLVRFSMSTLYRSTTTQCIFSLKIVNIFLPIVFDLFP